MQRTNLEINFAAVRAYAQLPYRESPYGQWLNSCVAIAMFHWEIRSYPDRIHARQPADDTTVEKLTVAAKRVNGNMVGYAPLRGCAIERHFGVTPSELKKAYKRHLGLDYYKIGPRFKRFPATCMVMMASLKQSSYHVAACIRGTVYDGFDSPSGSGKMTVPIGVFM